MPTQRFALIDDRLVEDTYLLRRSLGQPRLQSPAPLISPGLSFGAVLRDLGGPWRMWYCRFVTRDPAKDGVGCATPQCLAYSRDGIRWEQPSLGLVAEGGSRDNNIIIGEHQRDRHGRYLTGYGAVGGMCILDAELQAHPCARARFTALYGACPKDSIGGILLASSDDGIHWEAWPENPILPGNQDTQNILLYDDRLRKYVCYHRPMIYCRPDLHANRKLARCESEDLVHWTPGQMVLDTDDRDADAWEYFAEPAMHGQRGRIFQFQGMTPWIANGCYLALAWLYDSRAGDWVLELVHSADGIQWQREARPAPFLGCGRPAGFEGRMPVTASSPPVLVGDEEYFYYSANPHGHHEIALADTGKGDRATRQKLLETTSIYLATIPRDRWISYDAGDRAGELLTRPLDLEVGRLALNLRIADGGRIRVEVEDQWARPVKDWHLDEIPAIDGPVDAVDLPVTFGPGPKTVMKFPPVGPVRFRFKLQNAQLFGWSLT